MAEFTFRWPSGPHEVFVTGDFDNWSGSMPLVKSPRGDFALTLPIKEGRHDRFEFKFIVDGEWKTSEDYKTVSTNGNENNYLIVSSLATQATTHGTSLGNGKIPEIGMNLVAPEVAAPVLGTQAPQRAQPAPGSKTKKGKKKKVQVKRRIRKNKHTGEKTIISEERSEITFPPDADFYETEETATTTNTSRENTPASLGAEGAAQAAAERLENENQFSHTVMPSSENQQQTLSEPGIAIVPNPQEIKEFSEVRDVNAKDLNAKLNAEMKEKEGAEAREKGQADAKAAAEAAVAAAVSSNATAPQLLDGQQDAAAPVTKDTSAAEKVPSVKDLPSPVIKPVPSVERAETPEAPVILKEPLEPVAPVKLKEPEEPAVPIEPTASEEVDSAAPVKSLALDGTTEPAALPPVEDGSKAELLSPEQQGPVPVEGAVVSSPTDVVAPNESEDALILKKDAAPAVTVGEQAPEVEEVTDVGETDKPQETVEDAVAKSQKKAVAEKPLVVEEVGIITSPEQEEALIQKTLDPKAKGTEELLIVEGNISPEQLAEIQAASDKAADAAMRNHIPETKVVSDKELIQELERGGILPSSKSEQKPAQKPEQTKPASTPIKTSSAPTKEKAAQNTTKTEEKKKKKKGLFSKMKKLFS
ncbi:LAMI_0H00540g1_1 [Lachancea mirantina]|uniref:LAMI_0H00540g1_1 n=1 Tax=Lachancea mirantina TaxID=1230905 RepID=A0A1G4KDL2_9SACH|nr:LAMI_0H00540g1_1 [Lachancea mirantina]